MGRADVRLGLLSPPLVSREQGFTSISEAVGADHRSAHVTLEEDATAASATAGTQNLDREQPHQVSGLSDPAVS